LLSFGLSGCLQPAQRSPEAPVKPLTTYEELCLKNAAQFVAARGRTPATRTTICAVTNLGHSAHITNP
jgi:hypothetical protein